jgi:hypothetical protein
MNFERAMKHTHRILRWGLGPMLCSVVLCGACSGEVLLGRELPPAQASLGAPAVSSSQVLTSAPASGTDFSPNGSGGPAGEFGPDDQDRDGYRDGDYRALAGGAPDPGGSGWVPEGSLSTPQGPGFRNPEAAFSFGGAGGLDTSNTAEASADRDAGR